MVIKRQKEFGNKDNKAAKKKWETIIARYNNGPENSSLSEFRKKNRTLITEPYPGSSNPVLTNVMDSINFRSLHNYPEIKKTRKSEIETIIKHKKAIMKEVRENKKLLDCIFKK